MVAAVYEAEETLLCDGCVSGPCSSCDGCGRWVHEDEMAERWLCVECHERRQTA
jgi:hypothetical protein